MLIQHTEIEWGLCVSSFSGHAKSIHCRCTILRHTFTFHFLFDCFLMPI